MRTTEVNDFHTEKVPAKWRKHLILVEWELRERKNLLESIRRFRIAEYQTCLEAIRQQMRRRPDDYIYIIKLVYRQKFYKLPNIVISREEQIEEACRMLEAMDRNRYSEIWYCSNKARKHRMVFGRLMIDYGALYPSRVPARIELVWGNSARNIEKYPDTECPYAAIWRENWNAPPVIEKILPCGMDTEALIDTAVEIARKLGTFRREILEFGTYVFSKGCSRLSLEFSYDDHHLSFIDWDSDNDGRILFSEKSADFEEK